MVKKLSVELVNIWSDRCGSEWLVAACYRVVLANAWRSGWTLRKADERDSRHEVTMASLRELLMMEEELLFT